MGESWGQGSLKRVGGGVGCAAPLGEELPHIQTLFCAGHLGREGYTFSPDLHMENALQGTQCESEGEKT